MRRLLDARISRRRRLARRTVDDDDVRDGRLKGHVFRIVHVPLRVGRFLHGQLIILGQSSYHEVADHLVGGFAHCRGRHSVANSKSEFELTETDGA